MSKHGRVFTAACGLAVLGIAAPAASFDGTYTGERVLTGGDVASCQTEGNVSVTINGNDLTFTNSRVKEYTISFDPRPDGSFGQLSADVGGDVVHIQGHINGNALDADVASGHCQYHWHLEKP